ncbi:MAG: ATP phosphoribosyltransferase regulatory subunit, partial [Bacilli bacterium]|nr:ATP phosphoribosyltransferase regulatory subunit [Bacilli bacterium]
MEVKPVKGTHDIIGTETLLYQRIEDVLAKIAHTYGYLEYRTPIIEHTELFSRSVGDSSDIVRKEMYTFNDKGNRSLTLRPEVTASIIRTIVNNKLFASQDLPIKACYLGPTFRYERPQAGRYRQVSQFGVEAVGLDSHIA